MGGASRGAKGLGGRGRAQRAGSGPKIADGKWDLVERFVEDVFDLGKCLLLSACAEVGLFRRTLKLGSVKLGFEARLKAIAVSSHWLVADFQRRQHGLPSLGRNRCAVA